MHIQFDLADIHGDTDAIKLREATRLGMLALACHELGHGASLINVGEYFSESQRWEWFAHLGMFISNPTFTIVAAHNHTTRRGAQQCVAFKYGAEIDGDARLLKAFDLLVAHHYDPAIGGHPRLVPIPLLVHDSIIQLMSDANLLPAYAADDLQPIRDKFNDHDNRFLHDKPLGFIGMSVGDRRQILPTLEKWCEYGTFETPGVGPYLKPSDYLRWMSGLQAALILPGVRPKTYRFTEAVVMGIPTVTVPSELALVPPITTANSIMLQDWGDDDGILAGLARRREIALRADAGYRMGWSPQGQMKQVFKALGLK